MRNAESIIKLKYKTKLREQWVVGWADQGGRSGQGMCEETIKNCWVRGSESARGAAEENGCVVVVVTGLWVRVWWLNDKKLYDLLWVKWRLDKVGFDCCCCCCCCVYRVLYLASLLPVVTAIDCWYCFIVLASHVTFFHFFLLLLSFLALLSCVVSVSLDGSQCFCSFEWWVRGCEIDSKRHFRFDSRSPFSQSCLFFACF